jgi:hypothetical protein
MLTSTRILLLLLSAALCPSGCVRALEGGGLDVSSRLEGGAADRGGREVASDGRRDRVIARDGPYCGKQGALFCSGFERPLSDEWTAQDLQGLAIVGSPVHAGAGALRSSTTAKAPVARVAWKLGQPWTSGTLYLRAFIYLPTVFSGAGSHVLLELNELATADQKLSIDLKDGNGAQLVIEPLAAKGPALPTQRWICLELAAGETSAGLKIDDALVITTASSLPKAGIGHLYAGVYSFSTSAGYEAYFDDVVLSSSPIGCN